MGRFDGKVAVVTGASRGIGFETARQLVDGGARVVLTARGQEGLDAAVEQLGGDANAIAVAGKADDAEHRSAVFEAAKSTFGGVDFLVNNTGINPAYGRLTEIDNGMAHKIMEVNLFGAYAWSRLAVENGINKPGGAIVNIASVAGLTASPGIGFYGISKAAVISLTQQLAFELAPNVRVNAVAPAVVKTDFAKALFEGREEQAAAGYPLQRLGAVADVAGPVTFLLSEDAAWITGQTLSIDGGASLAPIL